MSQVISLQRSLNSSNNNEDTMDKQIKQPHDTSSPIDTVD